MGPGVRSGRRRDGARARGGADIVGVVHAETSTGVLNPVAAVAAVAQRARRARRSWTPSRRSAGTRSDLAAWGIDACYSCTQKCIGAPSGLAPVAFAPARARHAACKCRSFYFDLQLLEDYWLRRKYHHTISASLVYALHEALLAIEEEGLEARWERHERHHLALAAGLDAMGLGLLPPEAERLWTLNAVRVPDGVDEAQVRKAAARASSTWRSAPASGRWPARSCASA